MTKQNRHIARESTYIGERAIHLKSGRYEAYALPQYGGNLVALRDIEDGFRFLHEPQNMDAYHELPVSFGIPVLFPPNRFEDGKFPWNGNVYQLPINEPERNNHLHGFFYDVPWEVEFFSADAYASRLSMVHTVDQNHTAYEYFPHTFTIRLQYTLNEDGLHKHVMVKNEGTEPMPCLLAFHTSFNAPFSEGSSPDDYVMKVTIGERWEMNERMLPTGRFQPLSQPEQRMKEDGDSPYFEAMDYHYTAAPQNGRNRMELTDRRLNVTLVYDVGTAYRNWMIWNNNNSRRFFSAEPQINLVNAPNLNLELQSEDIGLFSLAPGEIWEETSRIYRK